MASLIPWCSHHGSTETRCRSNDTVFQLTRGVSTMESMTPSGRPVSPPKPTSTAGRSSPELAPLTTARMERPIRLAALDGDNNHFADLTPRDAPIEIVKPRDTPDIVWDPTSRDVIAW